MRIIEETNKYFGQQCQDAQINNEFRKLHGDIVDMIAKFCRDHDIVIDEFHLSGDDFETSCEEGIWMSECDSSFELEKFDQEYKDACSMKKFPSKKEWTEIKARQKPYLLSM